MWGQFEKKTLMLYAFASRCRVDQDRSMGRVVRWAYALKALICLFFGRKSSLWAKPHVIVATWGYSQRSMEPGADWWDLCVGTGVVHGWHYDTIWDGS